MILLIKKILISIPYLLLSFFFSKVQLKEDKPKVSYSIFSYMESSVHDKESFTKEQTKFSGSKSINTNEKPQETPKAQEKITIQNTQNAPHKRMTVAELFLKESEKDLQKKEVGQEVTETIEKFDKMDLYKAIFLSDSENEEDPNTKTNDFIDTPKNVERNNSPPRGIFANIDFDEINSWRRNVKDTNNKTENKDTDNITGNKDTDKKENTDAKRERNDESVEMVTQDVYGPQIPVNLQKKMESNFTPSNETFKPKFRSKDERNEDSSSSDSWVDAKEIKSKKQKKSKKKKSKHKKSKHKKKDR